VPITGSNAKRVVFGAIDLDTGGRVLAARRDQRGADFEGFLEEVRGWYRRRPVAMLLDEDSSHTAGDSQDLAGELGVELLWLPKRSPHLNPMDHLWRHAKQAVLANHQHASIDGQVERFIGYLGGLPAHDALQKAGLLSPNCWLRQ
jgi:transposase